MKINRSKFKRTFLIFLPIVLLVIGFLKMSSPAANNDPSSKENAITVTAIAAQQMSVPRKLVFSGPIVGRDEVPIFSDLPQGRIDKILVEEGQHVKAGQVLATIDSSNLVIQKSQQEANVQRAMASISQQESAIEEAQAQLAQAKSERIRGEAVAESGLLSKEASEQRITAESLAGTHVQAAKNSLKLAQADLALANAQLAESDLHLRQATIRSPVSGTLIERKAKTGMSIGQTTEALFQILRDDDIEVELEVSGSDAPRLTKGMPVTIQIVGDVSGASVNVSAETVMDQVNAWAEAWSNKDIESYLGSYSSHFLPDNQRSKKSWESQRRKKLETKDNISVRLENINVHVEGNKASEQFLQHFQSKSISDDTYKQLDLELENGHWLIVKEKIIDKPLNVEPVVAEPNSSDIRIYDGKVSRPATQIGRMDQIAKVRVRFDRTPSVILGQFARVSATSYSRLGYFIPESAVRFEGVSASVYTVKNGLAVRVPVKVGERIGDKIEITEGLSPNMLIIDSSASFLSDGEPVRVKMRPSKV